MLQGHSAREVRVGGKPMVSVLLTSTGPRAGLEACLDELTPVCGELEAQLVVARAYNDAELAEMRRAHPTVHFAPAPAGSTASELRAIGMGGVNGDIVVLGDDTGISAADVADRCQRLRHKNEQH